MEIYKRLVEINKEVEPIKKEKTNQQQGFKFRGIDDVMISLHDLLAKHDVFITSEILGSTATERQTKSGGVLFYKEIDYKFNFFTTDGSSVSTTVRGEAMDSGDKGSNKCISIALKYALFNMFLIPTAETAKADPDAETHEVAPHPQQSKPKELTPEQIALQKRFNEFAIAIDLCETIEQVDANVLDAADLMQYKKVKELVEKKKQSLTK